MTVLHWHGVTVTQSEKLHKTNEKGKKIMTLTPEYLAGRGYTISRAARAVDVSTTHLRLVLKGQRTGSRELLKKLRTLPKYHPITPRVSYTETKSEK